MADELCRRSSCWSASRSRLEFCDGNGATRERDPRSDPGAADVMTAYQALRRQAYQLLGVIEPVLKRGGERIPTNKNSCCALDKRHNSKMAGADQEKSRAGQVQR